MTKFFVADARRRWSEEEKQAIIEESKTNPVARVAKKHGVATSLLFRWSLRIACAVIFVPFLQRQLELCNLASELLGRLSELQPLELCDPGFQLRVE
jgi:hypothetical protein